MRAYLLIGLIAASVPGQAQVYQRLDPLTGQITFTNRPPPGQQDERDEEATEPPVVPAKVQPTLRSAKGGGRPLTSTATPAAFPRVNAEEQKRRDQDRHTILSEELRAETEALARLGQRPDTDETARRHRANIASLQRELAALR